MDANVRYYDWVRFFNAVCSRIAELYEDTANREQDLRTIAEKTFSADHAILKYSTIDPFSYIYALAQRNTKNQKKPIFTNVKEAFGLDIDIPTDYVFPSPTPQIRTTFHSEGLYITNNGKEIGNTLLWDLFKQAYNGNIIADDFKTALSIKYMGLSTLTQSLFLINPKKYFPFDEKMNILCSLSLPNFVELKNIVARIKEEGFTAYCRAIEKLKSIFQGCELYEINLLNILLNWETNNLLKISDNYWQIGCKADGECGEDYFKDFIAKNAVWTGNYMSDERVYRLKEVKCGDIIFVRIGLQMIRGVCLVLHNGYNDSDYDKDNHHEDKYIKVFWLEKKERKFEGEFARTGFSGLSNENLGKLRTLYPTIFYFLDEMRKRQKIMINHAKEKYKNIILQGPPGTGKTRMAKQVALWLSNNKEKKYSLIETIDKNIKQNTSKDEYFNEENLDIDGNEQIKLIQFHPSYTYEDFVRGIKVKVEEGKIKYEVENKILASFAQEARENLDKTFVLIIDEINRANLSSVLGELIYALEYRGANVNSMYAYQGENEVSLPNNLYIIGTMNTADRSASHIDYAIRRRFAFIPVLPNREVLKDNKKAEKLFDEVEKIISDNISPEFDLQDIQIGHSYFLVDDENELAMRLKYEIIPLLNEYIKDGILLESAKEKVKELCMKQ